MRGNRSLEPAFLLATGFERVVSYRRRGSAAQPRISEDGGA
jgi:hypothetical protein